MTQNYERFSFGSREKLPLTIWFFILFYIRLNSLTWKLLGEPMALGSYIIYILEIKINIVVNVKNNY